MRLELRGLGYRYPGGVGWALEDFDAVVGPGERLLVTGPSGCGKSTLARVVAGLLQRHGAGELVGEVLLDGEAVGGLAPSARVQRLGFVGQEPSAQVVSGSLADEVAMGPESACWPRERVDERVRELLERFLPGLAPERDPLALSGGQQQRLAVAAGVAAGAPLLILDEPLAQLDPLAARELLETLAQLCDDGVSVILVEHRLEACLDWASRLWLMGGGRLAWDGAPAQVEAGQLRSAGLLVPERLLLDEAARARGCEWEDLEAREGRSVVEARANPSPAPVLELADLRWRAGEREVLHGVSVRMGRGERVAVMGANGAGKSSLLTAIAAREPACLLVPQEPDLSLFCATVVDEIAYGPSEAGHGDPVGLAQTIMSALRLRQDAHRSPQALSRGQRLRVAVGAALSCEPAVLLLDEPSSGQDLDAVQAMMTLLDEVLGDKILVFSTHDVGLALRHATTVWVVQDGELIAAGSPPLSVLAALPPSVPLRLGPVATACAERGWDLCEVDQLVARLC